MVEQPVRLARRAGPGDKDLGADDPYELTGVRYPVEPGVDADRELARTLIEEFAMQGWGRDRIAGLFADPHAGGAHDIHRRRGEAMLDELFDEVFCSTPEGS